MENLIEKLYWDMEQVIWFWFYPDECWNGRGVQCFVFLVLNIAFFAIVSILLCKALRAIFINTCYAAIFVAICVLYGVLLIARKFKSNNTRRLEKRIIRLRELYYE